MSLTTPARHITPYSERVKGICSALALLCPNADTKFAKAMGDSLHALVRAEAYPSAKAVAAELKAHAISTEGRDDRMALLVKAVQTDLTTALKRVDKMLTTGVST